MTEQGQRSWEEAVDHLRRAANELRTAAGMDTASTQEEEAAAARLKHDVSRLQETATDLREKFSTGFDEQRREFTSNEERERAEQAANQMKASIDELVSLARHVIDDIATVASNSLKQAEPELKSAIRVLEDVAASAGDWLRVMIETRRGPQSGPRGSGKPLDEL